jgi:tetratricopeptide (TPR) repeat protein
VTSCAKRHQRHQNPFLPYRNLVYDAQAELQRVEGDSFNGLYAAQLYMGSAKDLAKARDLLERAVHLFNGDATKWSLYYLKGQLAFQTGAIMESKAAFEKSLQYNPLYTEAKEKLDEVNKMIKEHDRVMIKFR